MIARVCPCSVLLWTHGTLPARPIVTYGSESSNPEYSEQRQCPYHIWIPLCVFIQSANQYGSIKKNKEECPWCIFLEVNFWKFNFTLLQVRGHYLKCHSLPWYANLHWPIIKMSDWYYLQLINTLLFVDNRLVTWYKMKHMTCKHMTCKHMTNNRTYPT